MDIKFACGKCGQHLVIDHAGAGITIDCPGCDKAVCVPSLVPCDPPDPAKPASHVRFRAFGSTPSR